MMYMVNRLLLFFFRGPLGYQSYHCYMLPSLNKVLLTYLLAYLLTCYSNLLTSENKRLMIRMRKCSKLNYTKTLKNYSA